MLEIIIAFLVGLIAGAYLMARILKFSLYRSLEDGTFETTLAKYGVTFDYDPRHDTATKRRKEE